MNTQEAIQILQDLVERHYHKNNHEGEALTHAIEHMKRGQWQDISAAPKDGTEILLSTPLFWDMDRKYTHQQDARIGNGCYLMAGWYIEGRWQSRADQYVACPTHWMPLPKPPQERKD
jgi:hypothetical protein